MEQKANQELKKSEDAHSALFRILDSKELTKGQQRRLEILEAAIEVICSKGIEAASFETIGKQAGLHKAHVNYYYKQKPDLIEAVLVYVTLNAQRYAVTGIKKATLKAPPLQRYVYSTLEWSKDFPKYASIALLMFYYCRIDPKMRAMQTNFRNMSRERIMALILPYCLDLPHNELLAKTDQIYFLIAGALTESTSNNLFENFDDLKKDVYHGVLKLLNVESEKTAS